MMNNVMPIRQPDDRLVFNALAKELHALVSNKPLLRRSVEHFFNDLLEEITIGIIFEMHRKYKTKAYDLDTDDSMDDDDSNDEWGQKNLKKNQDILCSNCDRSADPTGYSKHLEVCMGLKQRDRCSSRRVATSSKDRGGNISLYSGSGSVDDENDLDWDSTEKRKNKKRDKKGKKKGRGTPKKNQESEPVEPVDVDIVEEDEELTKLRTMLHLRLQDNLNDSSVADLSTGAGSSKKKDRLKKRSSSRRDRLSPSSNYSAD